MSWLRARLRAVVARWRVKRTGVTPAEQRTREAELNPGADYR